MKKFIFLAMLLCCLMKVSGQTVSEDCAEFPYQPHFIHPVPYVKDTLITNPTENNPPAPPENGKVRGIFFVHGLGGNANSWDRANEATVLGTQDFPARNVITALTTYGSNSLSTAGLNLEEAIWTKKTPFENAGVTDHLENYIISHSQGGLVSRMTDKHYDIIDRRMFGGIVTFGSPNGGAQILNSRNEGEIEQLAAEGCKALGSAELLGALGQNVSPFLFNITSNGILQVLNGACDLGAAILPFTLFSELNTPISYDYHVGADELNNLNGHGNPNVIKVAMHGVEYEGDEDPLNPKQLMWRTFSSRGATSAPIFQGDDDSELVDKANEDIALYLERYNYHYGRYRYYRRLSNWGGIGAGIIVGGINWSKALKHLKLARAYYDAYSYMLRVDDRWKLIIGAKQWVANAPEACMCEWINNIDGWSHYGIGPANTPAACEALVANYNVPGETINCSWSPASYVLETKASDGVVTQESQVAFPGATPRLMPQTNHFQMRNSSQTKDALNDLYNGNILLFFKTEEK